MQNISRNHLFLLIFGICGASAFTLSIIMLFSVLNHSTRSSTHEDSPLIQGNYNRHLKIELVAEGLFSPTSMAFLDNHKILVLEKNTGAVRLISHGILQYKPVLKLRVDPKGERGLLGIAVLHTKNNNGYYYDNNNNNTEVFLYFTESKNKNDSNNTDDEQLRNRVYKYDWNGQTLIDPRLVVDLPAFPGPYHNGGKLIFGPDHYLYIVIGDLAGPKTQALNNKTGPAADGTGGILRVPQDGRPVSDPILGKKYPLKLYYAYGIRNNTVSKAELVNFPGSHYSDPVFSWYHDIGVTDIQFLNSSKLGDKYKNNLFVGDINNGNLYYFEVNDNRTGLEFNAIGLKDKVADNEDGLSDIIFASGFRGITDIETSPDGYLYILSYLDGKLYRIVPS